MRKLARELLLRDDFAPRMANTATPSLPAGRMNLPASSDEDYACNDTRDKRGPATESELMNWFANFVCAMTTRRMLPSWNTPAAMDPQL